MTYTARWDNPKRSTRTTKESGSKQQTQNKETQQGEAPPPHNLTNWTYKEKYNAKDCQ